MPANKRPCGCAWPTRNCRLESDLGAGFDNILRERMREADEFYQESLAPSLSTDQRAVARQAYAGLLWSKQFYHYIIHDWLEGDPQMPQAAGGAPTGSNSEWPHLYNRDVISMPDKWEYPWFAAWDLAFHMMPMARDRSGVRQGAAGAFLREWYMHPNGQIPAYEFAFGDVNPPVHAWACWRVYKMTGAAGSETGCFSRAVFKS